MSYAKRTVRLMGTIIDIAITHPLAKELCQDVVTLLKQYNQRFSANDSTSELSQINQQAGIQPVTVHPELFELIAIGKQHSLAQPSYLNIAIGPLIKAWRIGFSDAHKPSQEDIDYALQYINPENIIINPVNSSVFLRKKGMEIDLGALAKGYIADRIMAYLEQKNVQNALLNLGGNLVTLGAPSHRDDKKWRVGVQDPMQPRGQNKFVIKMGPGSIVTSGIYERVLKIDGQTYHHIFDSDTGYPMATDIASMTIISKQSVDGEIWTTRLFGLPADDIIATVNKEPGIEAIVIKQSGDILTSQHIMQFLL